MSASFLLPSFAGEGFIYQACCQCLPFVFNIRNTYLGLLCLKCLDCSMHFWEKQKVWESTVLAQVPAPITFGSLSLFLFVLRCFHPSLTIAAMLFDFACYFLQIKNEVMCIVLWNLEIGAGRYFLATQSYLSCRCFSRGLSGKILTLKIHLNDYVVVYTMGDSNRDILYYLCIIFVFILKYVFYG